MHRSLFPLTLFIYSFFSIFYFSAITTIGFSSEKAQPNGDLNKQQNYPEQEKLEKLKNLVNLEDYENISAKYYTTAGNNCYQRIEKEIEYYQNRIQELKLANAPQLRLILMKLHYLKYLIIGSYSEIAYTKRYSKFPNYDVIKKDLTNFATAFASTVSTSTTSSAAVSEATVAAFTNSKSVTYQPFINYLLFPTNTHIIVPRSKRRDQYQYAQYIFKGFYHLLKKLAPPNVIIESDLKKLIIEANLNNLICNRPYLSFEDLATLIINGSLKKQIIKIKKYVKEYSLIEEDTPPSSGIDGSNNARRLNLSIIIPQPKGKTYIYPDV